MWWEGVHVTPCRVCVFAEGHVLPQSQEVGALLRAFLGAVACTTGDGTTGDGTTGAAPHAAHEPDQPTVG